MRSITIAAVAAAAAAGIIAAVLVLYAPVSGTVQEGEPAQRDKEQSAVNTTSNHDGYKQVDVEVNGFQIVADIAATGEQRSKGLAVKDDLEENQGMLFVFAKPSEHAFWMYNMKFPIDIIWLDSDRTVVHIEHGLEPCGPASCPTYRPDEKALYVLETVAGFAEMHDVTEGTIIEFDPSEL